MTEKLQLNFIHNNYKTLYAENPAYIARVRITGLHKVYVCAYALRDIHDLLNYSVWADNLDRFTYALHSDELSFTTTYQPPLTQELIDKYATEEGSRELNRHLSEAILNGIETEYSREKESLHAFVLRYVAEKIPLD